MHRLIHYELSKIWRKRSFLLSVCVLLILNVFLLWYVNIPTDEQPPLSSYRSFQSMICKMSESEKADYISDLKATIDGVVFVQEILTMQNMQTEMGNVLAEQKMSANPGIFEKYYEVYQNGTYLHFTDSLWQEKTLIDELYAEQRETAGYDEYLQSVQAQETVLNGISIFGNRGENSFSAKNIEKSAEDYAELSNRNIRWTPSKALSISMDHVWTELFLILSVFLFVGNLIFEEKAKKLFYITRSTKNGRFPSIFSKLTALFIHCAGITVLLYGANLVFAGVSVGFGDLSARIQSVSGYIESNLPVSIFEYLLYSVFTKCFVLFAAGTIFTALCIFADNIFVPYLAGFCAYGVSYLLYLTIPAAGENALFKYVNFIGLLKTQNLYGSYLNFNIFGFPVSRLKLSLGVTAALAIIGITVSAILFACGNRFELKKRPSKRHNYFRPYASLLRHECYKIMITNRAFLIILSFTLLIGGRIVSQTYRPSAQEQYYQDMMMQLEGNLTAEKEALILSEQARYDEAFSEIERIDCLAADKEISENAADALKAKWQAITFFYPSFERVLQQYRHIQKNGGNFIYDTGYLYLFGKMNDDFLTDLLLLSLCAIAAFGNAIPMEYENGSWRLLSATKKGKWKIIRMKAAVCVITVAVLSLIPIVCRFIRVSSAYPLRGLGFAVTDLPCCRQFPLSVSVWCFIALMFLSQTASLTAASLAVLAISYWRKNHMQTVFFAVLILAAPLVLKLLGFSFAGWFSVYPFYSWTAAL